MRRWLQVRWGSAEEEAAPLAPLPRTVQVDAAGRRPLLQSGESIVLLPGAGADASAGSMVQLAAVRFAAALKHAGGVGDLPVTTESGAAPALTISWSGADHAVIPTLAEEGYRLQVLVPTRARLGQRPQPV